MESGFKVGVPVTFILVDHSVFRAFNKEALGMLKVEGEEGKIMARGFMYLSVIIDLQTRYVLSWSVSNSMSADWCAELVKGTILKYGKPEIFNSDQGSQYTSNAHTELLLKNEIKISMDGKGRAIDNIFVERLWRSVKYENGYLQAYTDGTNLYKGLKEYFKFYKNERFHQSLHDQTPSQAYYLKCVA